jgi:hypothetical protein
MHPSAAKPMMFNHHNFNQTRRAMGPMTPSPDDDGGGGSGILGAFCGFSQIDC